MATDSPSTRADGRAFDELRPVQIATGYQDYPEGSALIECGDTRVLCAASIQETQPPHLLNTDQGWVTAEYAMLPRATHTRSGRESVRGRLGGRTQEIQRLIGRALRSAVDLPALGPRTVILDCDVLQADGGTRTAAITGAYVSLSLALHQLVSAGVLASTPLESAVAAISVGIVNGSPLLDLCYTEDYRASADVNVVMTGDGQFVEVQGTAEGTAFSRSDLDRLLDLAHQGVKSLLAIQEQAIRTGLDGDEGNTAFRK
ncbi:MAG: ribonuclease PH [Dehalococcoidia bacterium]|nr:ribonuclease PH [Dehalococcoidia bacterium]